MRHNLRGSRSAPVFARYKSELKARVILGLRAFNTLFPQPPPFHLPNLSSLLQTHHKRTQFFIKLDISNFFWSLHLPSEVKGMFTFAAGDTHTCGTRCLPFGWSWSPIIAQLTLARILAPVAQWFPARLWQYVDDILISDEDFRTSCTSPVLTLFTCFRSQGCSSTQNHNFNLYQHSPVWENTLLKAQSRTRRIA